MTRPGFVATRERDLFVIRFNSPTPAVHRAALARLVELEAPRPRTILVLIPHDAELPDKATRADLVDVLDEIYAQVDEIAAVLLGTGLQLTLARGVATVLVLAMGMRGRSLSIYRSTREAATALAEASGRSADSLVELLVARGLLEAGELGR